MTEKPDDAHYQAHERIDALWDEYDRATATQLRVLLETNYGDPRRQVAALFREGARADVFLAIQDATRQDADPEVARLSRERDAAMGALAWISTAAEGDHNGAGFPPWVANLARQTIHAIETGAIHNDR